MTYKPGESGNPKGRAENPENVGLTKYQRGMRFRLNKKYGITLDEYWELYEKQKGVCALCGKPETKIQARGTKRVIAKDSLNVDHDHATGKVRGLLCYRCNTGIGKLFDDPSLLRKAADYLERKLS